ncbi:hypothetical protein H6B07_13395 [Mediterraneibacter glycyrrhizinilyticus]|nr:hypothetical protein [Mediterraneibacter glycyrrhizinilyticus]
MTEVDPSEVCCNFPETSYTGRRITKKKDNKYRRISGEHSGIRLLRNTPKPLGIYMKTIPMNTFVGNNDFTGMD